MACSRPSPACRAARAFSPLHLERLAHGCRTLGFAPPAGGAAARGDRASRGRAGALDRQADRDPGSARRCAATQSAADERATRVAIRYPWPVEDPALQQQGVSVRVAALRLGENPGAGRPQALQPPGADPRAQRAASGREPPRRCMLSRSGKLISGTMTNVFLVDGPRQSPRLRTPAIDLCGVARRHAARRSAGSGPRPASPPPNAPYGPRISRPRRRSFSPTRAWASGRWAVSRRGR